MGNNQLIFYKTKLRYGEVSYNENNIDMEPIYYNEGYSIIGDSTFIGILTEDIFIARYDGESFNLTLYKNDPLGEENQERMTFSTFIDDLTLPDSFMMMREEDETMCLEINFVEKECNLSKQKELVGILKKLNISNK